MDTEADASHADGINHFTVDLRTYRLTAAKKAAYRLADKFTAVLGGVVDNVLTVELKFKAPVSAAVAAEGRRLFFQELLDQDLREIVAEETTHLRTLILAQAFSRTDLLGSGE